MNRIGALDGIRAFAILAVIGTHTCQRLKLQAGYVFDGVGLFFVLSGFLITTLMMREREVKGRVSLGQFYIRRIFRIVPPLYVYLLLVTMWCGLAHVGIAGHSIIGPALFLTNVLPENVAILTEHTWSLSVEEQFYLVWPVALLFTWSHYGITGARRLAAAMIVSAPVLRAACGVLLHTGPYSHRVGYFTFCRMDALGAGCLVALLSGSTQFEAVYARLKRFWWVALLTFGVISPALFVHSTAYRSTVGYTVDALCMAGFLLWATRNGEHLIGRVLNHRAVVWIGTMSYSMYLYQTLIVHAGTRLIPDSFFPYSLVLIPLAALLSYWLVERPALFLRTRILDSERLRKAMTPLREFVYRLPAA